MGAANYWGTCWIVLFPKIMGLGAEIVPAWSPNCEYAVDWVERVVAGVGSFVAVFPLKKVEEVAFPKKEVEAPPKDPTIEGI